MSAKSWQPAQLGADRAVQLTGVDTLGDGRLVLLAGQSGPRWLARGLTSVAALALGVRRPPAGAVAPRRCCGFGRNRWLGPACPPRGSASWRGPGCPAEPGRFAAVGRFAEGGRHEFARPRSGGRPGRPIGTVARPSRGGPLRLSSGRGFAPGVGSGRCRCRFDLDPPAIVSIRPPIVYHRLILSAFGGQSKDVRKARRAQAITTSGPAEPRGRERISTGPAACR